MTNSSWPPNNLLSASSARAPRAGRQHIVPMSPARRPARLTRRAGPKVGLAVPAVWPARHEASDLTGLEYLPMGRTFRLRADFDITGFAPEVQVNWPRSESTA